MARKQRKLEFDDIFSCAKDHSLAAEQPELVEAIVATLPGVDATPAQKQEFACEVISELPYFIAYAKDTYALPILRDELLTVVKPAIDLLSTLHILLVDYRARMKLNLDAAHSMNPRIAQELDVNGVANYLKDLETSLQFTNARERKQRQDLQSIIGESVAEYLHKQFHIYFGIKPQSGKGRRTEDKREEFIRDYDRLCALLNSTYSIKISKSTKIGFIIPSEDSK